MRGDSVRYAEAKGLSREERTQMGRWEAGSMDACYGRTLPINAMRTMAGFSPNIRNYKIHRDLPVPDTLLKQVFPGLEVLYQEELQKDDKEQVYAKIQFIETLLYFRKVILQDSCKLKIKYPDHPIFNHPVFSDPAYVEFQEEVLHASQDEYIEQQTLEERLPAVMEHFDFKINLLYNSFEKFRKYNRKSLKKLTKQLNKMKVKISFDDGETSKLEKTIREMILRTEGFDPEDGSDSEEFKDSDDSSSSGSDSDGAKKTSAKRAKKQRNILKKIKDKEVVRAYTSLKRNSLAIDTDERPRHRMRHCSDKYTNNPPPEFKMDRNITTVANLWREWYVGTSKVPAVEFLEETYGTNWRREERDRIWFSKRKTVIRVVQDLAVQNGISKTEAIITLDNYLEENEKTLNFVSQSKKVVLETLKN